MSRVRQFIAYAALITMSVVFWVLLSLADMIDGIEQEALSWRYLVRGEKSSAAPIVFVDVDPETITLIGDKPWDRLNFAQTFAALLGPGGARAVGVDIIFSPLGTGSLLDVERARKGDYRLGQVVERYSDKLVLAAAYTGTNRNIQVLPLRRHGYVDPAHVPFPEAPTFPIIKYDSAPLGLANVDVELSEGSVPYKVPAVIDTKGRDFSKHLISGQYRYFSHIFKDPQVSLEKGYYRIKGKDGFEPEGVPAFSSHRLLTIGLEVFLAAHGLDSEDVEWNEDNLVIRKDGEVFRRVPLVDGQSMEVNWMQGWDVERSQNHYSMAEVLKAANALGAAASGGNAEEVARWEEWFKRFQGKVIFIGGVDSTLKDLAPTPFNRAPVPKVGLHANIYRTLESEAYVRHLDGMVSHLLVAGLAILVSSLLFLGQRGRSYLRTGSVLVLLAYVGVVFYCFTQSGYVLPLIAPVGASVTSALSVIVYKLGTEERQRRRIKNLFGAYVSPRLVEEMVEMERDPKLGGVEAEVTALFSDVEGFSSLSEQLSPNDLVALMNDYLGVMTEAFQNEQGTLDKYIGDAIVTMFGMPYPVEDHALRACRSAIRMQERHAELREQWAKEGKWPEKVLQMRTRIGINTGEAVIGNMGSAMRFNYTMMGDSVNLAARCESGAKSYGVYTMITDDTLKAAIRFDKSLSYRKLDRIIVKGRSAPVDIYELWDGSVDPDMLRSCKDIYEAALENYFKGEWERALAGFEACLAHEPGRSYSPTTPSEVLAARCREYLNHGAPEDWDGAYRMRSK